MDEATHPSRAVIEPLGLVTLVAVMVALRPSVPARAVGHLHRRASARGRWSPLRPAGTAIAGLAIVASAVVAAPLGLALVAVVSVRRLGRARRLSRARAREIDRMLPDVIELVLVAVESGMPTRRALAVVASRVPEPLAGPWAALLVRVDRGQSLRVALDRFRADVGPAAGPFVDAVLTAESDGVALGPALDRCATEARRRRRLRAEESARRVPVLMLFPLVFCVLPAFVLLTVVPLIAGSLADLGLTP